MKKIETVADVREWARSMVDANGDKFTPLTKGEQFVIAKYIVETDKEMEARPDSAEMENAAGSLPKGEPGTPPPPTLPESSTPNPVPCKLAPATMTRAYAYHRAEFDVQQVYDKFLEWCNAHPKEKEVMDFSNGQKSVAAAFAYWLTEIITVDVPV